MEPIVITGASGFLGSSFLLQVLRNPEVKAVFLLARRPLDPSDRYLTKLFQDSSEAERLWKKVVLIQCDLSDSTSLERGLDELAKRMSRRVRFFHLAAQISEKADLDFIRRLNLEATRRICLWCNEHAVRLTFVSSVAAFGSTPNPVVRSERDFGRFDRLCRHSIYFLSKREAQLAVEDTCKIPYDILCPSVIHGAWDTIKDTRSRLNPFLKKGFQWVPPGGANFVSLKRVLEKLNESLGKPTADPAKVEIVGGANWTLKQYIENYLRLYGIERELKIMPRFVFKIFELLAPLIPRKNRSLLHGARYLFFRSESDRRSEAEIGEETMEAMRESVRTLKEKDSFG